MGQALFWLESAAASVLFVALGAALMARVRSRVWRGLLRGGWWLLAYMPWAATIAALWFIYKPLMFDGAFWPLVTASVAGCLFVVTAFVVGWRGRSPLPPAGGVSPPFPKWRSSEWQWGYYVTLSIGVLLLFHWVIRLSVLYNELERFIWFCVSFVVVSVVVAFYPKSPRWQRAYPVLVGTALLLLLSCFVQLLFLSNEYTWFKRSFLGGASFVLVALFLREKGRVPPLLVAVAPPPQPSRASRWRLDYIAVAWAGAVVLAGITFWNLELAVRQEIATLRIEASVQALAVSSPRLPDAMNAEPLYRQASDVFDAQDVSMYNIPNMHISPGGLLNEWLTPGSQTNTGGYAVPPKPESPPFNPADPQMLEFLANQGPTFDLLRQASQRPGFDVGTAYSPPSVFVPMPSLPHIRQLGKLLCLSAQVKAHHGDPVGAMEDLNIVLTMARHCTDDPTLIATLVANALEALTFSTFQHVLNQGPMTADALDALAAADLARSYASQCARSLQLETATNLYAFTMDDPSVFFEPFTAMMPSSPSGGGSSEGGSSGGGSLRDWLKVLKMDERGFIVCGFTAPYRVFLWRQDLAACQQYTRRRDQLAAMPFHLAVGDIRTMDQARPGGLLTHAATGSLFRAIEFSAVADAHHRLMALAVAMWRFRLVEGAFPEELSQLAPTYIPTVPLDPFTGEAMKLTRSAEGVVTLYSVGPDLKDDGGAPLNTGWPRQGDIALTLGSDE
jgi:hypothetical protein